jgi:D-amino-acid dehydrogenase
LKIAVLGAGVIGVTTAYYLARAGHTVTVLDQHGAPGMGTTRANGGQISVGHPESWASPAVPAMLLDALLNSAGPLRVRPRADPAMWAWGLGFLFNCRHARHRRNSERIARLAVYSQAQMRELQRATGVEYERRDEGILHVFTDPSSYRHAKGLARLRRGWGIDQQVLDASECVAVEPALRSAADRLAGGIYAPGDQTGNAHLFTSGLADHCTAQGVEFVLNTEITGLETDARRITGALTRHGRIGADAFVVALGVYSAKLLRPLGLRLPVFPVKGYSATLPIENVERCPTVSITYEARRIVISRLGMRVRIAGGADVVGYDDGLDRVRAEAVTAPAFELFPEIGNPESAEYWAGLRPMTSKGPPVLGKTRYHNLFLNTGHGSLGWTLACGSARAVSDLVSGDAPEIPMTDYTL